MRFEIADAFNILDTLESVIYSVKACLVDAREAHNELYPSSGIATLNFNYIELQYHNNKMA